MLDAMESPSSSPQEQPAPATPDDEESLLPEQGTQQRQEEGATAGHDDHHRETALQEENQQLAGAEQEERLPQSYDGEDYLVYLYESCRLLFVGDQGSGKTFCAETLAGLIGRSSSKHPMSSDGTYGSRHCRTRNVPNATPVARKAIVNNILILEKRRDATVTLLTAKEIISARKAPTDVECQIELWDMETTPSFPFVKRTVQSTANRTAVILVVDVSQCNWIERLMWWCRTLGLDIKRDDPVPVVLMLTFVDALDVGSYLYLLETRLEEHTPLNQIIRGWEKWCCRSNKISRIRQKKNEVSSPDPHFAASQKLASDIVHMVFGSEYSSCALEVMNGSELWTEELRNALTSMADSVTLRVAEIQQIARRVIQELWDNSFGKLSVPPRSTDEILSMVDGRINERSLRELLERFEKPDAECMSWYEEVDVTFNHLLLLSYRRKRPREGESTTTSLRPYGSIKSALFVNELVRFSPGSGLFSLGELSHLFNASLTQHDGVTQQNDTPTEALVENALKEFGFAFKALSSGGGIFIPALFDTGKDELCQRYNKFELEMRNRDLDLVPLNSVEHLNPFEFLHWLDDEMSKVSSKDNDFYLAAYWRHGRLLRQLHFNPENPHKTCVTSIAALWWTGKEPLHLNALRGVTFFARDATLNASERTVEDSGAMKLVCRSIRTFLNERSQKQKNYLLHNKEHRYLMGLPLSSYDGTPSSPPSRSPVTCIFGLNDKGAFLEPLDDAVGTWFYKDPKKIKAFPSNIFLEERFKDLKLTDLHTHLTGCGSSKFWVDIIMLLYLPHCTKQSSEEVKVLQRQARDNHECSFSWRGHEIKLCDNFTTDVVYDIEYMQKALLGYHPKGPARNGTDGDDCLHLIEALVTNSKSVLFSDYYKEYMVLVGDGLKMVTGLPNEYFVRMLTCDRDDEETNAVYSRLCNCFTMLSRDACAPRLEDLADYRGRFTPQFDPMRYAMKDPILEQRPEVYSLLLNHACTRYHDNGVKYVEFSVSIKQVMKYMKCFSEEQVWPEDPRAPLNSLRDKLVEDQARLIERVFAWSGDLSERLLHDFYALHAEAARQRPAKAKTTLFSMADLVRRGSILNKDINRFARCLTSFSYSSTSKPVVYRFLVAFGRSSAQYRKLLDCTENIVENYAWDVVESFSIALDVLKTHAAQSHVTRRSQNLSNDLEHAIRYAAEHRQRYVNLPPIADDLELRCTTCIQEINRFQRVTTVSLQGLEGLAVRNRSRLQPNWSDLVDIVNDVDRIKLQLSLWITSGAVVAHVLDQLDSLQSLARGMKQVVDNMIGAANTLSLRYLHLLSWSNFFGERPTRTVDRVCCTMAHQKSVRFVNLIDDVRGLQDLRYTITTTSDPFMPSDRRLVVAKMWPLFRQHGSAVVELLHSDTIKKISEFRDLFCDEVKGVQLREFVVGFDNVGDEDGFPTSAFACDQVIEMIRQMRLSTNSGLETPGNWSGFGIRLHGGENVKSGSHVSSEKPVFKESFRAHMQIIYHEALKLRKHDIPVRIGHGIAFLYSERPCLAPSIFDSMRRGLKMYGIPCELNMTSNHYLVSRKFCDPPIAGPDAPLSLREMLAQQLEVCLSTDNDGIWECGPCSCKPQHHCSVAHEFCLSWPCFNNNVNVLERVLKTGWDKRFGWYKRKPKDPSPPTGTIWGT